MIGLFALYFHRIRRGDTCVYSQSEGGIIPRGKFQIVDKYALAFLSYEVRIYDYRPKSERTE